MKDLQRWSYRGCACCDGSTLSLTGAALSRRHFIAGAAAAMAAVGLGKSGRAAAQTAEAAKPYRIDVHHHLSPPTYIAASNANNFGDPLMKNWTAGKIAGGHGQGRRRGRDALGDHAGASTSPPASRRASWRASATNTPPS